MEYQTTFVSRTSKHNLSKIELYDASILRSDFKTEEFSRVKCTVTDNFENYVSRILKFEVKSDDVWVISEPKSGQEIISEIAWLALNHFDFVAAKNASNSTRVPYFELKALLDFTNDSFAATDALPSPRTIKTHLPIQFLPADLFVKKPKVIYIYRDVTEVVIAYYYHCCAIGCFSGTKEEFVECFMNDDAPYLPYWTNVGNFWKNRENLNMYFVSYNKLKNNLGEVVKEVCQYLGRTVPSDEIIGKVKEHLEMFDEIRELEKQIKNNEELKTITGEVMKIDFSLPKEMVEKLNNWTAKFIAENGLVL